MRVDLFLAQVDGDFLSVPLSYLTLGHEIAPYPRPNTHGLCWAERSSAVPCVEAFSFPPEKGET